MRTVWKWTVPLDGKVIGMPVGAYIVHVAAQFNQADSVQFWAEVDDDHACQDRRFTVVGTGEVFDPSAIYVGTAIGANGGSVWHLYEVPA